ncbi:uncharacterized protein P884DRAFT_299738 [Thermothelomyces heterothallicus CBS 202.75]|uniref:uncharacterized protein n=1 Tax=Thermothelomyces heterothallicus CBS 202.75 TaxID=1149848 RepID=UPI0037443AD9
MNDDETFTFGHGGSGYLLSKGAMAEFVGKHPAVANEYDVLAREECCGDYVFARALKDKTGLSVQQSWPTMNGEKPSTLPFVPSHWCHPIVTMHHMGADEINTFWHFERRHHEQHQQGAWRPLLLRDIYHDFVAPHLSNSDGRRRARTGTTWRPTASTWTRAGPATGPNIMILIIIYPAWQLNRTHPLAEQTEPERAAPRSPADCAAACRALPAGEYFRYKYADGACSVAASFALGRPAETAKRTVSGWEVDRIRDWVRRQGGCAAVEWPAVERGDGI